MIDYIKLRLFRLYKKIHIVIRKVLSIYYFLFY